VVPFQTAYSSSISSSLGSPAKQQKLEENARTGGNGGSKLGAMIKSALTEEVVEIRVPMD